jgi:hypothetical protein
MISHNILNIFTVLSVLLSVLTGGRPDMTLSARTFINARTKGGGWLYFEKIINLIFFLDKNHCYGSFLRDLGFAKDLIEIARTLEEK